jgi:uncharacterized delta-60 repeat protein
MTRWWWARGVAILFLSGFSLAIWAERHPLYAQRPGSVDTTFIPAFDPNWSVNAFAVQPDGKIVVGGAFAPIQFSGNNGLLRLTDTGAVDPVIPFVNGAVGSVALQTDGKIVIGGGFSSINSTLIYNLARLSPDGLLDSGFNSGSTGGRFVSGLAIQSDGKVLVRRDFADSVTRLQSDGTIDSQFSVSVDGWVEAVALQNDGRILIAGVFQHVNGIARRGIARLTSDGSVDATFGDAGLYDVSRLAVYPDNSIILFGSTQSVGPRRLIRLDANGVVNSTFTSPSMDNYSLAALALQSNGKIVIGGWFAVVDGQDRRGIVRLNADGTLDRTFDPGSGVAASGSPGAVNQVAIQPADGKILIGGPFDSVDGITRNRIARLHGGEAPLSYQPDLLIRTSRDTRSVGDNVYIYGGYDQMAAQSVAPGLKATSIVTVQNDGTGPDSMRITAPAGRDGWAINYFDAASAGADISAQITATNGWTTPVLQSGASLQLRIEFTPSAGVVEGRAIEALTVAQSVGDPIRWDTVMAAATMRRVRGQTLITDSLNHRVIEVDADKRIVWQYGDGTLGSGSNQLNQPYRARRLANGNTLIADLGNDRVVEVTRRKAVVWQFDRSSFAPAREVNLWGHPSSAERLANGNTLITAGGHVPTGDLIPANAAYHSLIEVTPDKKIVWQVRGRTDYVVGDYPYPVFATRLANGGTLVTHTMPSDVVELGPTNATVWSYSATLTTPRTAVRLANRNTLIADAYNGRVIEVDSLRRHVWHYGTTGTPDQLVWPESAVRLSSGNTLIADFNRVFEVDPRKNVVWQFGQSATGSGVDQLNRVTDAQRIGP